MSTLIKKCDNSQHQSDHETDQRHQAGGLAQHAGGHRGNESQAKPHEIPCKLSTRFPFWLDGRFFREYLGAKNKEYGRKFVWTDGSKMNYTNWEKRSNFRKKGGCGHKGQCFGEPQDLPASLCLHGGVDLIGTISAKAKAAAIEEEQRCYTWGNQQTCTAKLPFVCKRARVRLDMVKVPIRM